MVPPEWNLDFATALTRLLTATCIGLIADPHELRKEAGALWLGELQPVKTVPNSSSARGLS